MPTTTTVMTTTVMTASVTTMTTPKESFSPHLFVIYTYAAKVRFNITTKSTVGTDTEATVKAGTKAATKSLVGYVLQMTLMKTERLTTKGIT
jgi:hypothetical protein